MNSASNNLVISHDGPIATRTRRRLQLESPSNVAERNQSAREVLAVAPPIVVQSRARRQNGSIVEIRNDLTSNDAPLEVVAPAAPTGVQTRARRRNWSFVEIRNNSTAITISSNLIVGENAPIATRTRARGTVPGVRRNRTIANGGRGQLRRQQIPRLGERNSLPGPADGVRRQLYPQDSLAVEGRNVFQRNARRNQFPSRPNRRVRAFRPHRDSRLIDEAFPHELFFEYFHRAIADEYPNNFSPVFPLFSNDSDFSSEMDYHFIDNSTENVPPFDLSTAEISDPANLFKCAICLELCIKKTPVVTKCGHIYCGQCILEWLNRAPTCPKCNSIVEASSLIRIFP